jgi:hypothetical protein
MVIFLVGVGPIVFEFGSFAFDPIFQSRSRAQLFFVVAHTVLHCHRRRTSPATYNVQRIVRQVPVELYTIISIHMHVRGRGIFRAETVCIWECARRMHVEVRGE